jgi:spore coat protein U-like protein
MLKKSILHLSVAAALLAASGIVLAESRSTNLAVSASVSQNCTISTMSNLAFGAYDPIGVNAVAALNTSGQVSVACPKGANGLTIGMGNGANASGTQRQMLGGGTIAGALLQYNLFKPSSNAAGAACTFPGATAWTTTDGGLLELSSPTTKAARVYNVCGTIPGGQDVSVGSYTDTVSATITF